MTLRILAPLAVFSLVAAPAMASQAAPAAQSTITSKHVVKHHAAKPKKVKAAKAVKSVKKTTTKTS